MNGAIEMDAGFLEDTEIQVLKIIRSDSATRPIATLKPYLNGWFEMDLPYPGKYTFKAINKALEAECQLPSVTITLDSQSAREVQKRSLMNVFRV